MTYPNELKKATWLTNSKGLAASDKIKNEIAAGLDQVEKWFNVAGWSTLRADQTPRAAITPAPTIGWSAGRVSEASKGLADIQRDLESFKHDYEYVKKIKQKLPEIISVLKAIPKPSPQLAHTINVAEHLKTDIETNYRESDILKTYEDAIKRKKLVSAQRGA